jgi:DNA-binding transcriptional ArsR family regulator
MVGMHPAAKNPAAKNPAAKNPAAKNPAAKNPAAKNPAAKNPAAKDLASLAGLLADPTRAAFCLALLDGRAWTAGELAAHAGVRPPTATEHLNRMLAAGLLVERRQGRHRYVELAGPQVAQLIEDLSAHTDPTYRPANGLRGAAAAGALARGRTCYDHLAGRLGVAVTDALTGRGLLNDLALTEAGMAWLADTVGDLANPGKRQLARACLDWTERRPHLAGLAGARLCTHFFDQRWIKRVGTSRAVRVTPAGERALRDLLGVDAAAL